MMIFLQLHKGDPQWSYRFSLPHARRARDTVLFDSHLPRVPSVAFKILSKLAILQTNRILPDRRQEEKRQKRAQQTQTGTDKERDLAASSAVRSAWGVVLDDWEHVRADESADLAHGGRNRIVLSADGGRAGLGCHQADVVPWPRFAQREEDAGSGERKEEGGVRVPTYPYTKTKPPTCAAVFSREYNPDITKPTRPCRPTPIANALRGPIQSLRKAPPIAPGR